jgi:hypothetical protein
MSAAPKQLFDQPADLTQLAAEQVEAWLDFYVDLGLSALRRRQALCHAAQVGAYARPESAARSLALRNLAVEEALLAEAVWRTAWPDERHVIDVRRWSS